MLYNIKRGYNGIQLTPMAEVVILVSSLYRVEEAELPFVSTDRHAYLQTAQFKTDLRDLNVVDWEILAARNFRRDPNDPGTIERYQAEALIHHHVPVSSLFGIACNGPQPESRLLGMLETAKVSLKIVVKPEWYF